MGEKAGFRDVKQLARGHTARASLTSAVPDEFVDGPDGPSMTSRDLGSRARLLPSSWKRRIQNDS